MLPKERVLLSLERKVADRVPLDGSFRPEIWQFLKEYLNKDDQQVKEFLGLDFQKVGRAPGSIFQNRLMKNYKTVNRNFPQGQLTDWLYLGDRIFESEWGVKRYLSADGYYYGYCYHPLENEEDLDSYKFPNPDDQRSYQKVEQIIKQYGSEYLIFGSTQNFYRHGWELRGMEQLLMDLYLNTQFVYKLNDRLYQFKKAVIENYIKRGVRIIGIIGDIASQNGMLMDPDIWRKFYKPYLKKLIEFAKSLGKKKIYFYFHSDGNCEAIIPDLIEIGFDILNPIQPECMDPVNIKKEYGNDITLHGTISIQQTLPFGKQEDVREEVKKRIFECGQDGGLIIAPSNLIQPDVPIENLIALYQTCQEYKC